VAIDDIDKTITFCEVKLNPKRLNKNDLIVKSQKLVQKYAHYEVKYLLLSINDIDKFNITN